MDQREYIIEISRLAHLFGFVPFPIRDKLPVIKGWPDLRNDPIEDLTDKNLGKLPKAVRRIENLSKYKNANNIGIVTGEASGVVVIDVDVADNGIERWKELASINGGIPDTFTVQTPSGGLHYYFKYTEDLKNLINGKKIYGLPFDYRTNGGMVVFPGSKNREGIEYKVLSGYINGLPQLAEMPTWLKTFLIMDRIRIDDKIDPTPELVGEKAFLYGVKL